MRVDRNEFRVIVTMFLKEDEFGLRGAMVAQLTFNQLVVGSSPTGGINNGFM